MVLKVKFSIILILLNTMIFNYSFSSNSKIKTKNKQKVSDTKVKNKKQTVKTTNNGTYKKSVLNKIKTTNNNLNRSLKKGLNNEIRSLIADARRFIRLAVMSYRRNKIEIAEKFCDKAIVKINKIDKLYLSKKKILDEYNKNYRIAKHKHSKLHRMNLSGKAERNVYKAGRLISYASYFAGHASYKKANKLINRAMQLLKEAESEQLSQKNKFNKTQKLAAKAIHLTDKTRSLLWKMRNKIVPGPIHRDYYKARGYYLRGVYFSRMRNYNKSIEELNKSLKILTDIPNRISNQGKLKSKASIAIRSAQRKYDLIQNKRLVHESLSSFIKAKKLLKRAKLFYKQSDFKRSEESANQAYKILKEL